MAASFRFSPRANRAHEIAWRPWGPDAFAEAEAAGRPVYLLLTAGWGEWCHRLDEEALSDPDLIATLNEHFIPMRVDADRHPHVQDRYIAGGWPTNAFLTPTGEVLWSAAYTEPHELQRVATGVQRAWDGDRATLLGEIERRRRALEAARTRHPPPGLVRREAADDVLSALRAAYDPRNGGFGDTPRFPDADPLELLYLHGGRGDAEAAAMADTTLDGILAGHLWDAEDGGFFRYATGADWTEPRREKLLETQAELLRAFALGAHLRQRPDWAERAERTVAWVDQALGRPDGLWAGSLVAEPGYFEDDAAARASRPAPVPDQALFTHWNALWIQALAEAGGRLARADWIARAATALETLLETMAAPGGLLYHYAEPDQEARIDFLMVDALEAARACQTLAELTGVELWMERALALAAAMRKTYWSDEGGFWDRAKTGHDVGILRYRDRPFDLNAHAARFWLHLALANQTGGHRAVAERILAILSPRAGRWGVAGAPFALAAEEFFDRPLVLVVVGPPEATAALRGAALAVPVPGRRVVNLPRGGRLDNADLAAVEGGALYVCRSGSVSAPVRQPADLPEALGGR